MTTQKFDQATSYVKWKAWDAENFGRFTNSDRICFEAELRAAGVSVTKDTKVLEIGFGNGKFAAWICKNSEHYVGTESNPELVERAIGAGIEAHLGTNDLTEVALHRRFDLIVAFDVLEHLDMPDILTLLESAKRCLSDNGRIVFRVPSGDSPFSGPLMYGDITHKTRLGSKAIAQIATITGLEVVSTHDAVLPIYGMGLIVAIESILVNIFRKFVGAIIRAAFNGNKHAVISSNMVAVLRCRG
ncbi:MAG: class I SAM-dependent methyltransferase [Rhodanobacteraceae bacterium]|nr:MAG: class I SAM-dependent methyltransferase [Rhodanobacteraceae bacterium]